MTTTEQALGRVQSPLRRPLADLARPHALDGGVTWCARKWDADYRHNLHAHTPAELEEYLTEADAER